jgi:hypothetical protein
MAPNASVGVELEVVNWLGGHGRMSNSRKGVTRHLERRGG